MHNILAIDMLHAVMGLGIQACMAFLIWVRQFVYESEDTKQEAPGGIRRTKNSFLRVESRVYRGGLG